MDVRQHLRRLLEAPSFRLHLPTLNLGENMRILNKPFVVEAKTDEEQTAIVQGVKIYLKNLKAGVGTAKGLADEGVAKSWEERAAHLEEGLLARLNSQSEMFTDGVGAGLPLLEPEPVGA